MADRMWEAKLCANNETQIGPMASAIDLLSNFQLAAFFYLIQNLNFKAV